MIIKKSNQRIKKKEKNDNVELTSAVTEEVIAEEDIVQDIFSPLTNIEKESGMDMDLFDIGNIDFVQRQERRRGSRRRGYRRIDDRNLVSRAQDEAENIKKMAFDEGYRCGLDKASADMDVFREKFVEFMTAKKEVFEYIAPDILEISVDIAKTIIKKELELDPQIIINSIIDVLKTVSKNEPRVNLRVKPQAVEFVKDTIPDLSYQYGIDTKINVIADPSIEDGGCIFQTNNGIVDASIDTQLEIIKKALEA